MVEAKTGGFRWLPSYYEVVRDLPDKERLIMYDAIADYGFGNDPGELPPVLKQFFRLMIPSIDGSIRFEEKQRENGKKGGRPRKKTQNNPTETQKNPDESQPEPTGNLAIAVDVANAIANAKPPHTRQQSFGQYGWVKLTGDQYRKLLDDLGQAELERCIRYIDESAQSSGNKNRWRDWNLVIRRCSRERWGAKPGQAVETDWQSSIPRAY